MQISTKMILSDSPCIVDVGVAGMILAAEAVWGT